MAVPTSRLSSAPVRRVRWPRPAQVWGWGLLWARPQGGRAASGFVGNLWKREEAHGTPRATHIRRFLGGSRGGGAQGPASSPYLLILLSVSLTCGNFSRKVSFMSFLRSEGFTYSITVVCKTGRQLGLVRPTWCPVARGTAARGTSRGAEDTRVAGSQGGVASTALRPAVRPLP